MTRQTLAVLIDGVLHLPNGECSNKPDNASTSSAVAKRDSPAPVELMSEMDEVTACLANVVMLARRMSETDARRVRAFVSAAHSLLCSTTSLDKTDQRAFENALRDAARRN